MMNAKNSFPKQGEIWLLKNPERIKELGKDYRPVLIISNDERNEYDNSVVVLPLTTEWFRKYLASWNLYQKHSRNRFRLS